MALKQGKMDKDPYRPMYKELNNYVQWFAHAKNLRCAADTIMRAWDLSRDSKSRTLFDEDPVHAIPAATMLYGLALENLIKAYRLKIKLNEPDCNGDIKWLNNRKTAHDLIELLSNTEYDIESNEAARCLLNRLTLFIRWAGRYPTPTKSNEFLCKIRSLDRRHSKFEPPRYFEPQDRPVYDGIFQWFRDRMKVPLTKLRIKHPQLRGGKIDFIIAQK